MRNGILLACLLWPLAAGAEPLVRIDGYLRLPAGGDGSLRLEERTLLGGATVETASFDTGAGTGAGLRVLMRDSERPWLLGIDLSLFDTDNCCLDVLVGDVALAGGLRARHPLLQVAGGGVHPYALAGIDFAMIDGSARTAGISTGIGVPTGAESHIGGHVALGLDWQGDGPLGAFIEYRHTQVSMDTMTTNNLFVPTSNVLASGDLASRSINLGLAWYWRPANPPGTATRTAPTQHP